MSWKLSRPQGPHEAPVAQSDQGEGGVAEVVIWMQETLSLNSVFICRSIICKPGSMIWFFRKVVRYSIAMMVELVCFFMVFMTSHELLEYRPQSPDSLTMMVVAEGTFAS
ncbi:hypothetical protein RL74_19985 [Pseudomonas fluorescens]|uniref:Uncharacterized protein n=1 Tax=Pseudomonas fluorescens TaxID=294 RepID=A0A0D0NEA1_PSEFL|nr:hypothetical protein RL74_19985 [Pseudomonas fluorescens]